MDATRYVITQASTGVAIRLPDCFSFRAGREVWRQLCPEEWPYREYVLDLGEVATISDSGIAWLRFFLGWAEAAQVEVRLTNVSDALATRLMEAERLSAANSPQPAQLAHGANGARDAHATNATNATNATHDAHDAHAHATQVERDAHAHAHATQPAHGESPADVPAARHDAAYTLTPAHLP